MICDYNPKKNRTGTIFILLIIILILDGLYLLSAGNIVRQQDSMEDFLNQTHYSRIYACANGCSQAGGGQDCVNSCIAMYGAKEDFEEWCAYTVLEGYDLS